VVGSDLRVARFRIGKRSSNLKCKSTIPFKLRADYVHVAFASTNPTTPHSTEGWKRSSRKPGLSACQERVRGESDPTFAATCPITSTAEKSFFCMLAANPLDKRKNAPFGIAKWSIGPLEKSGVRSPRFRVCRHRWDGEGDSSGEAQDLARSSEHALMEEIRP
jgi:hypothetical protein